MSAGVTPRLRPDHIAISPTSVDAELLEVQRQERHHEREAGEADEARGGDREEILAPATERRVQNRILTIRCCST